MMYFSRIAHQKSQNDFQIWHKAMDPTPRFQADEAADHRHDHHNGKDPEPKQGHKEHAVQYGAGCQGSGQSCINKTTGEEAVQDYNREKRAVALSFHQGLNRFFASGRTGTGCRASVGVES